MKEVQKLVVEVSGPLLLSPVSAAGQKHDPAEVWHRRFHRLELAEEDGGVAPPADVHGSSEYRKYLIEGMVRRALQQASERVER